MYSDQKLKNAKWQGHFVQAFFSLIVCAAVGGMA